jgi:hypothetical protein
VNGRQFTGAIESGQLIGIAAVGLHAIGGFLGNERGCDYLAMDALVAQMTIQSGGVNVLCQCEGSENRILREGQFT